MSESKFKVGERWNDGIGCNYEVLAVRGFKVIVWYGGEGRVNVFAHFMSKEHTKTHEADGTPVEEECNFISGSASEPFRWNCECGKRLHHTHTRCPGCRKIRPGEPPVKPEAKGEVRYEIAENDNGTRYWGIPGDIKHPDEAQRFNNFVAWEFEDGFRSRVSPTDYKDEDGNYHQGVPPCNRDRTTAVRAVAVILEVVE